MRRWLSEMDFAVDFGASAQDVPLPTLRMLDLARALTWEPQLLVLDEITAALPADLAERVFAIMRRWREQGRSVLFISHRLAEVTAMCDRATVLRDGVDVGVLVPSEGGEAQIVETMLGARGRGRRARGRAGRGDRRRRPRRSSGRASSAPRSRRAASASAARSRTSPSSCARARSSASPRSRARGRTSSSSAWPDSARRPRGEILVAGKPLKARTPYDAIRAGVVLVPADRMTALLPQRSVRESLDHAALQPAGEVGRRSTPPTSAAAFAGPSIG